MTLHKGIVQFSTSVLVCGPGRTCLATQSERISVHCLWLLACSSLALHKHAGPQSQRCVLMLWLSAESYLTLKVHFFNAAYHFVYFLKESLGAPFSDYICVCVYELRHAASPLSFFLLHLQPACSIFDAQQLQFWIFDIHVTAANDGFPILLWHEDACSRTCSFVASQARFLFKLEFEAELKVFSGRHCCEGGCAFSVSQKEKFSRDIFTHLLLLSQPDCLP